jgi:hypothetical protein
VENIKNNFLSEDFFMENKNKRFTIDDVRKAVFYQLPKFLFTGEFKNLNNDARILYAVLKDRHELSLANKWTNDNNEVYIIFSRAEMCEVVGLSENTILKAMKTLKEYNLVEEERIGLGQANRIYLLQVETHDNTPKSQTFKSYGSKHSNGEDKDLKDLHIPSINKTYLSENLSNQSLNVEAEVNQPEFDEIPDTDMIDITAGNISEAVADKICLDELKDEHSDKHEEINMLNDIIVETLSNKSPNATVRVSKQNIAIHTVQQIFAHLGKTHIEYVIHSLNNNGNKYKIDKNTKSYLMTSLFHAPRTVSYFTNRSFSKPKDDNYSPGGLSSDAFMEKLVRKSLKF